MSKKNQISKKLRFEVFKRDNFECKYCSRTPPEVVLKPIYTDFTAVTTKKKIDRLETACYICFPEEIISEEEKEEASEIYARESYEQITQYRDLIVEQSNKLEFQTMQIIKIFYPEHTSIDLSTFNTIKKYVHRLGIEEVVEAAEISFFNFPENDKRTIKYFHGICNNKIKAGFYYG